MAKIIPANDKEQMRIAIEKDPEFERKQHVFLGMKVRNALRAGGFSYFSGVMDLIWLKWLKEAVCLTEDKIVLSETLKERVEKFLVSLQKPPTCPELRVEEVERIKKKIEERHKIRLPEIEIRYSDNILNAFCISAVVASELRDPSALVGYPLIHEKVTRFYQERDTNLKLRGLAAAEIEGIDPWKITIFLPRRYSNYPAGRARYPRLSQSNNKNEDEDYTGLEEEYAGPENLIIVLKTDKIKYNTNETITIELSGYNPMNKIIRHRFMTSQKFWGTISISNASFTDVIARAANLSLTRRARAHSEVNPLFLVRWLVRRDLLFANHLYI